MAPDGVARLAREGEHMNIALAYFSKTGHSRKIAEAVSAGTGLTACNLKDATALGELDLLILTTGIYASQSDPALLNWISKLAPGQVKRAALITSSMSKGRQEAVREALVKKGVRVDQEEYTCKGSFLFFGLGHPDADEIQGAVAFAKKAVAQQG
jgi:flavodoxin